MLFYWPSIKDAWMRNKENKQWRRLIQVYAKHINQGLAFMNTLRGWDIIGGHGARLHKLCKEV